MKARNVRVFALALVLVLLFTSLVPTAAYAGDGYCSQPGCEKAGTKTECSGHGSFGAFGESGDLVHDFGINNLGSNGKPGANGTATGNNNSGLCGNPQDG